MPDVKVKFVAGFGPIVKDGASKALYGDALGIAMEQQGDLDGYYHTDKLDGVRHFALWPLAQAAQSCFGVDAWPSSVPAPSAWIEFDVEDVAEACAALKAKGYTMLVDAREEPWGQTVGRLLSPEGLLVGVTFTPWMR